tara:strand:+ start:10331 stop:10687 length:357 start_codon:yes stop_codon:yes gene_type:complete
MANSDNLKPFKKGESGNPSGRPKGSKNRSTIMEKWLEVRRKQKNPITGEMEWMTLEDSMTLSIIRKSIESDVPAYRACMDSRYGTAKDSLDITSEGGGFNFNEVMKKLASNGDTESKI